MVSAATVLLEYVCPAFGITLGNIMFSASYKDVVKAVERGHLGDLNPTPWAFMLGNCAGWLGYSFIIQNLWVFWGNAPGFLLSIWLNLSAAKLQYQESRAKTVRRSFVDYLERSELESRAMTTSLMEMNNTGNRIGSNNDNNNDNNNNIDTERGGASSKHTRINAAAMEEGSSDPIQTKPTADSKGSTTIAMTNSNDNATTSNFAKIVWDVTTQNMQVPAPHENVVLGISVVWLIVFSIVALFQLDTDTSELLVGVTVNLNLVFFYGAPLSTILTVLRTRNTSSIHVLTMITNTANGAFWFMYGLAILNPVIFVPNGVGAGLGVVQIVLCVMFPRSGAVDVVADGHNDDNDALQDSTAKDSGDGKALQRAVDEEERSTGKGDSGDNGGRDNQIVDMAPIDDDDDGAPAAAANDDDEFEA